MIKFIKYLLFIIAVPSLAQSTAESNYWRQDLINTLNSFARTRAAQQGITYAPSYSPMTAYSQPDTSLISSYPVNTTGPCTSVFVDCAAHRISITGADFNPKDSVIDCGRMGLTKNGVGRVGGLHHGPRVKDGVEIEMPGMGNAGGGKVFHTCFWRSPPTPRGDNSSSGCVHVSPDVLQTLKSCNGAPMQIVNALGSGGNSAPASFFAPSTNGVSQ